jgi:hypothetical protein
MAALLLAGQGGRKGDRHRYLCNKAYEMSHKIFELLYQPAMKILWRILCGKIPKAKRYT